MKKEIKPTILKLQEQLEQLLAERQDYYDEKSERWQDGDRGQEYYDKTSELEDYNSTLTELFDFIEEL